MYDAYKMTVNAAFVRTPQTSYRHVLCLCGNVQPNDATEQV